MNNETKILGGIIFFTVLLFVGGIFFIDSKEKTKVDVLENMQTIDGGNVLGNPNASIIVVEFADFQCPACAVYSEIMRQVVEQNSERIKYIYKHFPLVSIHSNALNSAYAAEAAAKQDAFFDMHDILYERQSEWEVISNPLEKFKEYALELGLDIEQFKNDYNSDDVKQVVKDDLSYALDLGLDSTPTILINGKQYVGNANADEITKAIEKQL